MPRDPTTARARARGTPRACFAVACALALAASAGAPAAAASAPERGTARLAAIDRLTPAQFTAIERVYVAAVPLDELDPETVPLAELDAAARAVLRACRGLSRADPLLRAIRAGCPAVAGLNEATAAAAACSDAACLIDAMESARRAVRSAIRGSRISDRAVDATRLARRCKRALLAPPGTYAVFGQFDAAYGKLLRALRTGSPDDLAAAEAALARAQRNASSLPTVKRTLARLRSGCR